MSLEGRKAFVADGGDGLGVASASHYPPQNRAWSSRMALLVLALQPLSSYGLETLRTRYLQGPSSNTITWDFLDFRPFFTQLVPVRTGNWRKAVERLKARAATTREPTEDRSMAAPPCAVIFCIHWNEISIQLPRRAFRSFNEQRI